MPYSIRVPLGMNIEARVKSETNLSKTPPRALWGAQTAVWLFLVMVIAFSLRVLTLGSRSFWLDEAASSLLARVDWHTFVTAVFHRQGNMALYYLVLRGWSHLGDGESSIRFLSVVFGAAAIPLMYQIGKLSLGVKVGRIAALLLAVHAFHIAYSQEARGYSLAVLLALFSCYFYLKIVKSEGLSGLVPYSISSVLMVYAQVLGTLPILAQWLHAVRLWNTWTNKRRALLAFAVIALAVAPLLFALWFESDRSQLAWMNQLFASTLYSTLLNFSGNTGIPLVILEFALVAWSGVFRLRKGSLQPSTRDLEYGFLWLWMLLPVVLMVMISLRWPVLQGRYL